MSTTEPSPGNDLASLLAQYEAAIVKPSVPHYRASDLSRDAENVAGNDSPLPKPSPLTFSAPPPMAPEVPIDQIDSMLAPLRERLNSAEAAYAKAAAEAAADRATRTDLERAAAAIRNVSVEPHRAERPDGRIALKMTDEQWAAHKASVERGEPR